MDSNPNESDFSEFNSNSLQFKQNLFSNSNKENIQTIDCNLVTQQQSRNRFKVVKLVANPSQDYCRGRWNCKDFKDAKDLKDIKDNNNRDIIVVDVTNGGANGGQCDASVVAAAQQPTPIAVVVASTAAQQTTATTATASTTTAAEPTPNGVAIDNKIEQAMDLVKSHLMFAVREEVDVLKERIKELESEISILRAHATQDVLQLVQQQQQQQTTPTTTGCQQQQQQQQQPNSASQQNSE